MTKGLLLGVLLTCAAALAVWLGMTYTGAYNVAATDTHADAVRWTLETTMRRSVASRAIAEGVTVPESVPQEMIAAGARHYDETCAYCHGAPGVEPAEWSRGMRPEPPHLTEAASEWSREEIYWIVDNGIKMTGMPAFGAHHGDSDLTAITAFVDQLPGLSAEDYRSLTEERN